MTQSEGPKGRVTITVEWGYEGHTLSLSARNWSKIKLGSAMRVKGQGYDYEGESFADYWDFGGGLDGHLRVEYGDDGAVGFDGKLADAEIDEA